MKKLSWAAVLLAGLGLMAGVPSGARADTMFNLVTNGTLPAGNYGSVDVISVNNDELEIKVTLSGTNSFANTGMDASFAFSLNGFGTITGLSSSLPITWSALNTIGGTTTAGPLSAPNGIHMDGAGFFQYGALFSNGGNTDGSSLDIFITATGIGLNTGNVTGVAADICTTAPNGNNNCTGSTGGVNGVLVSLVRPVPAPFVGAGLPGLIAACLGLVAFARRRRSRLA